MLAPQAGQCLDLLGACEDLVPEGLTADLIRHTKAGFYCPPGGIGPQTSGESDPLPGRGYRRNEHRPADYQSAKFYQFKHHSIGIIFDVLVFML